MKKNIFCFLLCTFFSWSAVLASSSMTGTTMSTPSTTNTPNPNNISVSLVSSPTLKLGYDSNGKEVSLGSYFEVSITAPINQDISVDASRFEIAIFDASTGKIPVGIGSKFSFYTNKLAPSKINSYKNATPVTNPFSNSAYKIAAGTTADFDISSYLIDTKLLPPGTYYETLRDVTYYDHTNSALKGPNPVSSNTTNTVTLESDAIPVITKTKRSGVDKLGKTSATISSICKTPLTKATAWFDYGTTSSYGSKTVSASISANKSKTITHNLTRLTPKTTYHFKLNCQNSTGLTSGQDLTFTTK